MMKTLRTSMTNISFRFHSATEDENSIKGTAKFGMVEKERGEPEYIGAQAHTNNTGELTAMYVALCAALARPYGSGREIIWSDSLYAIKFYDDRPQDAGCPARNATETW